MLFQCFNISIRRKLKVVCFETALEIRLFIWILVPFVARGRMDTELKETAPSITGIVNFSDHYNTHTEKI